MSLWNILRAHQQNSDAYWAEWNEEHLYRQRREGIDVKDWRACAQHPGHVGN